MLRVELKTCHRVAGKGMLIVCHVQADESFNTNVIQTVPTLAFNHTHYSQTQYIKSTIFIDYYYS